MLVCIIIEETKTENLQKFTFININKMTAKNLPADFIMNLMNIIQTSIDLICESKKEKIIQNILAAQLYCYTRKTLTSEKFPDIEVDLYQPDVAIEVKLNDKYYAGIIQLLAQKILYNIEHTILLHIHDHLDTKFINAFEELSTRLDFLGILIDRRQKEIMVFNYD
jgi:hypothetical protein